ncbi:hypothetical protein AO385_0282 [Moraxella catarrhalis]|uniref:Uncharacterized protein n=1 Tax=Moraxella catarrhalis TaxID=480 RepID=A0A198URP4_MORCA|nr:hypothetical protein AO384_1685 [Moraxella catarrhalis]OAU98944.1 hypothetical protein AO382_2210 [Moraxella catarrhalis]OAU99209.1 hypothetical protein AO383_0279 [Moraxella catarrhalis]OAV03896.1 hypothetical protein AO385_0282 [Moraxella catarrhalis]
MKPFYQKFSDNILKILSIFHQTVKQKIFNLLIFMILFLKLQFD